jgi:hypothetical protein
MANTPIQGGRYLKKFCHWNRNCEIHEIVYMEKSYQIVEKAGKANPAL